MSIWKEVRCDGNPAADDCESKNNLGPQGFESVSYLHAQASKVGWLVQGGEAICPACRRVPNG